MRLAHTRHWRLWLARALAPCSSAAPRGAGSRSGSSTRFARLRRRASRGVDSASALRLACGAPRGRPPGPLRLCTARGCRFGGAPLAPRLAAAGWRFRAPRAAAAYGGGKKRIADKSMFHVKQKMASVIPSSPPADLSTFLQSQYLQYRTLVQQFCSGGASFLCHAAQRKFFARCAVTP